MDSVAGRIGRGAYRKRFPLSQALQSSFFRTLAGGFAAPYQTPANEPDQMMDEEQILAEFRAADALLEGHFILSSGMHSPRYLQCARVLMDPARASRLASALVDKLPRELRRRIEIVVSPAMGGVIIGHEVARALGVEALFAERPTGRFELRRGFRLERGQKVLLVEDVVTTGLSSREAIAAVEEAGGEVIAGAALVDRSNGEADLGVPFFPLITLSVPAFPAEQLPAELAAIPAEKRGSRKAA
jgi:orotate phosphoribosyltransferase